MAVEGWEDRYEGEEGPSHLARVLLGLLNKVWETQHVPACWRRASLVSIYKEKGDALEMDNYRGISLMAVPLKMLLTVLAKRLEGTLSRKGLLSREQAGFRAGEECVGQAAALLEVLQRRQVRGRRTYALFVDLSKAYDVVPHGALFAKMEQLGVRGRLLGFVQSLYASSELQVRMPLGESPIIRLLAGSAAGVPAVAHPLRHLHQRPVWPPGRVTEAQHGGAGAGVAGGGGAGGGAAVRRRPRGAGQHAPPAAAAGGPGRASGAPPGRCVWASRSAESCAWSRRARRGVRSGWGRNPSTSRGRRCRWWTSTPTWGWSSGGTSTARRCWRGGLPRPSGPGA